MGNRAGDRAGLPAGRVLTGAAGGTDQRPAVAAEVQRGSERAGEEAAVRRVFLGDRRSNAGVVHDAARSGSLFSFAPECAVRAAAYAHVVSLPGPPEARRIDRTGAGKPGHGAGSTRARVREDGCGDRDGGGAAGGVDTRGRAQVAMGP